jgi:hypothetical protein
MKRVLIPLAATAVMVLMFASAALADQHGGGAMTATATATASPTASPTAAATAQYAQYATVTATALAPTGGPSLGLPIAVVAGLALVGFGLAALVFVRRGLS